MRHILVCAAPAPGPGRPTPEQIRSAYRTILASDSFRAEARSIAEHFQQYRAFDKIAAEVEEQIRLVEKEHSWLPYNSR